MTAPLDRVIRRSGWTTVSCCSLDERLFTTDLFKKKCKFVILSVGGIFKVDELMMELDGCCSAAENAWTLGVRVVQGLAVSSSVPSGCSGPPTVHRSTFVGWVTWLLQTASAEACLCLR